MFVNLNPSDAKRLGRSIRLRDDWELVKYDIMYEICKAKFEQNADLKEKLLATGDKYLEEGNTWNDRCWGTCKGIGENHLGKILMRVRDELQQTLFDPEFARDLCVDWIRNYFDENGPDSIAIIGISGGKDSTVAAALCVDALGEDRVYGVLMPNGRQPDFDDAREVCRRLGISYSCLNIKDAFGGVFHAVNSNNKFPSNTFFALSQQAITNLPPRLRMVMLYAVAQSLDGRVINTSNLSEKYVGYTTYQGDMLGDCSPLGNFTSDEVVEIGLTYPDLADLVTKAPADGLTGKTDEDNLGFTYQVLNKYIRTGYCGDPAIKAKIDELHEKNAFKFKPMPIFNYEDVAESEYLASIYDDSDYDENELPF